MQPPIKDDRTIKTSLLCPKEGRASGLMDELSFWEEWVRTKSVAWPGDYQNRLDPESLLSAEYRAFIDHLPQEEIRILDVGAGPLTILGKKHPSKRLMIRAVDVLAERYDELLAKYDVQPIVRTTLAEAEKLTENFAESSFDLVTARNCLDHAVDPVEAIRQIILVTKRSCFAILDHAENEGETQKYQGLHQWNFTIVDDDLMLKGADRVVNVSRKLSYLGDFQSSLKDKWVKVCIRKR
jgi:ubiquinone/menaquinone biosynthesis C-methylase UbiE